MTNRKGFKYSLIAISLATAFNVQAANTTVGDGGNTFISNSDEIIVVGPGNQVYDSLHAVITGSGNQLVNGTYIVQNGKNNKMIYDIANPRSIGILGSVQEGSFNQTGGDAATQVGSFNIDFGNYGNTMVGQSNTLVGDDSSITGVSSYLEGNENVGTGSYQNVRGNENSSTGNNVQISGTGNVVNGNSSSSMANRGTVNGSDSHNFADRGTVAGSGATNTANAVNGVALGAGTVNDRADNVAVGGRTISDVADATQAHDAVNLKQLQDGIASVQASTYDDTQLYQGLKATNGRIDSLENHVDKVEKKLSQGIAGVAAMQSAPLVPGKTTVAVGGATYNGETAIGASFTSSINDHLAITGGMAISPGSSPVIKVGVIWTFD